MKSAVFYAQGNVLLRLQCDFDPFFVEEGPILNLDLLGEQEGAGLAIEPDGMELDFIGGCGGHPRAANNPDITAMKAQFGDVDRNADEIVDMRPSHASFPP